MLEHLPENVRSPAVARAVTSPSAVLLAGAGMAAGVLGGLPLAAAAVVGVLAWGARVAFAIPRRTRQARIDPFTVGEPWRRMVLDAQQARASFDRTVESARRGPLRSRLEELRDRLDDGVRECWRIAQRGDDLEGGLARLDREGTTRELAELDRDLKRAGADERPSLERARAAVRSQLDSAERIERVAGDARSRLRVLNAQMDEAVARAVELSLASGDTEALGSVSADVESLVSEMESLRQALEETTGTARAAGQA